MFSPTVRSIRNAALQEVIGLQCSPQAQVDELEIDDPAGLTEGDEDIFYELQELEEAYNLYSLATFPLKLVLFLPVDPPHLAPNDPGSILYALVPNDPETQHVMYRMRGLQSLLPQVCSVDCAHPGLVAQRDDLLSTISFEMNQMLSELWKEKELQRTMSISTSAQGIRRVGAGQKPISRYTSSLVTSAMILTAVVHTIMGVARNHCNFVLAALRVLITMTSKQLESNVTSHIRQQLNDIPMTLPTALHRLNLSPEFDIYVCCPDCSTLYPSLGKGELSTPAFCNTRDLDGGECKAPLSKTHTRGARVWHKPISRYSHMRFETWITELLQRPGIEDMMESTRPNPRPGTATTDVWDAPYMHNFLKSADPTFMSPSGDDLSLVMMLHFDFFNPFTNKTSGKVRSIGCFFMVCLNLPADVRYNASNAYLVSMVPGPREVKAEHLHAFIKPIVDDMLELYSPGILISRTHKYPRGRRVRAAIGIESMDIPAARGTGGFASHGHTCLCHLCNAKRTTIDRSNLSTFQLRNIDAHRQIVDMWLGASSLTERQKVFDTYGVRYVDWLRFPWWNPFESIVVGPMHWSKNVLDKHLRKNMNWTWDLPAGIPDNRPNRIDPITTLEYNWGTCAFLSLNEEEFKKSKLTASLVRYLCRQRGIFEAGLSRERLIDDLNSWVNKANSISMRRAHNIILQGGQVTDFALERCGELFPGLSVSLASAQYHASRPSATITSVARECGKNELIQLCEQLGLPGSGPKSELVQRLLAHYENIRIPHMPDVDVSGKKAKTYSYLGNEVLTEVKADMTRTLLPSWLKPPPLNFATASHGKLQAEEYKSLAFVSFTITLVRLWGRPNTALDFCARLENFLHLMIAVRILAFQSITESDIVAFELHYMRYIKQIKVLYPSCSIVPVHHLGLHIPHFLRLLGPSTCYSESTCEQFIGMFQNISTNFKFGDLEFTLHREFIMAARLKGMLEQRSFSDSLEEFGDVVKSFMQQHVPSQSNYRWETARSRERVSESSPIYRLLLAWSTAHGTPILSQNLFSCTNMRLGNVVKEPLPGRIENIVEDPSAQDSTGNPRIILIIRPFSPLSSHDSVHDPYLSNPIIGRSGAQIARLFYNSSSNNVDLVEPGDLISHVAVCQYVDSGACNQNPNRPLAQECIVVLSLDLILTPSP
ncbi:Transposase family Tnp2 protein [Ceratobasidium sp. AG-Ba]|nr:Transposase family Tnp2 protein [Ceratobasidium sp. AG-Ba]